MKILTVDIGTGTQDVFLFDSRVDMENGFKLVLPSPTMQVHRQIRSATAARSPIVLLGSQMGGGPSAWAAAAHARAGLATFATPDAALTLDDDLEKVASLGIRIVSEDEARALRSDIVRIELQDFDFDGISEVFRRFGAELNALDAVAVAAFDHGAAPVGVSDRQFRFDYLDRRIREKNSLSAFAYLSSAVPQIMSRLQAIARSGSTLDCPMVIMDSAPAAILGALFDPVVRERRRRLVVNVGNFHALAFRLTGDTIDGVFEHHTGEIDLARLEVLALGAGAGLAAARGRLQRHGARSACVRRRTNRVGPGGLRRGGHGTTPVHLPRSSQRGIARSSAPTTVLCGSVWRHDASGVLRITRRHSGRTPRHG